MTKLTLSSIPNSFLSSLSKSFFERSAKNAERAALKVAFGLVFFPGVSTKLFLALFSFIIVSNVFFLPWPSGFRSGPRSASAPAGRGQFYEMSIIEN